MRSILRRTRFAFLWFVIIPVAVTAFAVWLSHQFQSEIAWINHTFDVRSTIRETVLVATSAERSLQTYLLTRDQSNLRQMEADAAEAPKRLEHLRGLIADNPAQQRNVERLSPMMASLLSSLRQMLNLRRERGAISPMTAVESQNTEQLLDRLRDVSRDMMEQEERLLLARSQTQRRLLLEVQIVFGAAIVLTLLLLYWAGIVARDYAAGRDRAEMALQQKFAEIENLNRDLERRVDERTAAWRASTEELARTAEASRLLAAIVESSDDAIIACSPDGIIRTWNAGAARLYGYAAREIVGHNIATLEPSPPRAEQLHTLDQIGTGQRVEPFETVHLRKNGQPVEVSVAISPILDPDGNVAGASHVSRDITEQKKNAELMRQSQKLESLGVLAGGIAHDFNNLLTGILGNASLGANTLPPDSPAREYLRDVIAASEKAARLTQQMLAYSGRGRFVLQHIDLSQAVSEILPLIQAAIPRSVQLSTNLAADLAAIEADASQIQQVVMNLVINAAESIPEGQHGAVTITTRGQKMDEENGRPWTASEFGTPQPGNYIELEVSDSGSGMDAATKARIFEPFFTTKFTGRGLGLAAVLGIVRGHSGFIQVSSAPGEGTVFRLLFPAMQAPALTKPKPPAARDLTGTGAVLVIDDEPIVRGLARQALKHYGYDVLLAENGQSGVEAFRKDPDAVRCVVLDLTMPVLSGEETLPLLKSMRPEVPVILSSGFSEVEALRRFQGKGLAGFLQKPYRPNALVEKVKDAIAGQPSEAPR